MKQFVLKLRGHLHCLMLVFLLLFSGKVLAQQAENNGKTFILYFHLESADVDSSFHDNAAQLAALDSILTHINDARLRVTRLSLRGTASPDGNYPVNRKYARKRLNLIEDMICDRVAVPDSVIERWNGVAWNELAEVVRNSKLRDKKAILAIIEKDGRVVNVTPGYKTDTRVLELMKIDYGWCWKNLVDNYFETLRTAQIIIETEPDREPFVPVEMAVATTRQLEVTAAPKTRYVAQDKHGAFEPNMDLMSYPTVRPSRKRLAGLEDHKPFTYQMAFKTNAAAWALGITNAAVEVDLCRHLTLNVPVYYSAYNYFVPTIKFRTFMVQPELRYFFRHTNEGWFLGAHFGMGYYNLAVNGDYRIQDHNGESPALGGGLAFGYRMPLTRSGNWKVEFSLGAGAYAVHYDKFYNVDNGLMISGETQKKVYWGLDQANISFIYALDLQKGGGR